MAGANTIEWTAAHVHWFCLSILLTAIIVDGNDKCQRRAEWYNSANWRCPRSFAMLNFHPAIDVVTWRNSKKKLVGLIMFESLRTWVVWRKTHPGNPIVWHPDRQWPLAASTLSFRSHWTIRIADVSLRPILPANLYRIERPPVLKCQIIFHLKLLIRSNRWIIISLDCQ